MKERALYQWEKIRLYLHVGFASCVIIQLATSLVMRRPYLGRILTPFEANAFLIHSYSGICATILVLSYWFWIIRSNSAILRHLFPQFSKRGLKEIAQDIGSLLSFKLPNPAFSGGLPGFIQGLGLLLISFVGLAGSFIFFTLPNTQSIPPMVALVKEIHGSFAYWMWWYIGGHGGMALMHWATKLYASVK